MIPKLVHVFAHEAGLVVNVEIHVLVDTSARVVEKNVQMLFMVTIHTTVCLFVSPYITFLSSTNVHFMTFIWFAVLLTPPFCTFTFHY